MSYGDLAIAEIKRLQKCAVLVETIGRMTPAEAIDGWTPDVMEDSVVALNRVIEEARKLMGQRQ